MLNLIAVEAASEPRKRMGRHVKRAIVKVTCSTFMKYIRRVVMGSVD